MTTASPFAIVVGIDPGASNVGVCCWISTASGPEVLEAVTVELDGTGFAAVAAMSQRAVAVARRIVVDYADLVAVRAAATGQLVPAVLWCVEDLVPPRRDTQQRRAIAGSQKVVTAMMSTATSLGAVLASLEGELVQVVEPAGWDHREGGPDVLRGRQPHGWRGRRGSERQHQRSAYFLSEEGLRAWLAASNRAAPTVPQGGQKPHSLPAMRDGAACPSGQFGTVLDPPGTPVEPAPAAAGGGLVPRVRGDHCCIERQYGRQGCSHRKSPPTPLARARMLPTRPAPRGGDARVEQPDSS
jgi:hypothetical protein